MNGNQDWQKSAFKVNILLVDDRAENLISLQAILSNPKYRLVTAQSADEALQHLKETEFAVILTDVMMPEIDGFEFAKRLRELAPARTTPIIFVTAIARNMSHIYKAYAHGAVDYLEKPLDADVVKAKVAVFVELYLKTKLLEESERREREQRLAEKMIADVEQKKLETSRKRSEDRSALQGRVAGLLAEAPSLQEAWPAVLRTLCKYLGWQFGDLWVVDENQKNLRCVSSWTEGESDRRAFVAANEKLILANDEGMPGRVWAAGKPIWVPDIDCDPNFPRAKSAAKAHLHSAFGFPIMAEAKVTGVMSFYSRDIEEPDAALIAMMSAIGSQIGLSVQKKREEDARRASEERYRITADAAADAIFTIDETSTILFANRAAEKIFGHRPEDLIGKNLSLIIPARLRPLHFAGIERYIRTGNKNILWQGIELPGLHKDGHEIPLELSFGEFYERGHLTFTGVARDITERKRAEEMQRFLVDAGKELTASLDYHTTLKNVAKFTVPTFADWCITYLVDDDGQIIKTEVAHKNSSEEDVMRDIFKRFPNRDCATPGPVLEVLRTGVPTLLDDIPESLLEQISSDEDHLAYLRRSGFRSAMIVPLIARERVLGALSFVAAESYRTYELSDLGFAEELARRAALAVDNARLYRESQKLNRAKDEFLATIQHELRTPLNAIVGYLSLIREGDLNPAELDDALCVMDRNAKAQVQLVNDLLDVSRIITGQIVLKPLSLSPAKIIHEALESLRLAAETKEIAIRTNIEDDIGVVRGDPVRLRQVIWNLVGNSIKFCSKGCHIDISARRCGTRVEIAVKDTGEGIEPTFLPFVFDRFRQEDGTMTRRHGGTGLGLAIVRHLVDLHGGTISAHSAGKGRGALFTIMLPVASIDDIRPGAPMRSGQSEQEPRPLSGPGLPDGI